MTEYVVGFLFSLDGKVVVLVKKTHPKWQAGKYNGVGGHCEPGEEPLATMQREFREETGLEHYAWTKFGELRAAPGACAHDPEAWVVHLFFGFSDEVAQVRSTTEEQIHLVSVEAIMAGGPEAVPNVRWMLPMALSFKRGESTGSFIVQEQRG